MTCTSERCESRRLWADCQDVHTSRRCCQRLQCYCAREGWIADGSGGRIHPDKGGDARRYLQC